MKFDKTDIWNDTYAKRDYGKNTVVSTAKFPRMIDAEIVVFPYCLGRETYAVSMWGPCGNGWSREAFTLDDAKALAEKFFDHLIPEVLHGEKYED